MAAKSPLQDLILQTLHHIKDLSYILPPKKRRPSSKEKKLSTFQKIPKPLEKPPTYSPPPSIEKPLPKVTEEAPVQKEKNTKKTIKLEKIPLVESNHSLSIKKHLLTINPTLPLTDSVPDDIVAKERQRRGVCLCSIAILVFEKKKKEVTFLKNLEKALTKEFLPTKLYDALPIEKANDWKSFLSAKSLKLVIATDHEIFTAKNLMKLYKELPSSEVKRKLLDTELFLLPDLSLYFKQPILKRSLYKALCLKIKTL